MVPLAVVLFALLFVGVPIGIALAGSTAVMVMFSTLR